MAKIHIERAYIEPFGENEKEDFSILIHIKENDDHIYAGKVELDKNVSWIYFEYNENGDLEINSSTNMENNKWDHIILEILKDNNG